MALVETRMRMTMAPSDDSVEKSVADLFTNNPKVDYIELKCEFDAQTEPSQATGNTRPNRRFSSGVLNRVRHCLALLLDILLIYHWYYN